MNWQIKLYDKLNGDTPVLEYILSLPPKHRAKVTGDIDTLEKQEIDLLYPGVLKFKGPV